MPPTNSDLNMLPIFTNSISIPWAVLMVEFSDFENQVFSSLRTRDAEHFDFFMYFHSYSFADLSTPNPLPISVSELELGTSSAPLQLHPELLRSYKFKKKSRKELD